MEPRAPAEFCRTNENGTAEAVPLNWAQPPPTKPVALFLGLRDANSPRPRATPPTAATTRFIKRPPGATVAKDY